MDQYPEGRCTASILAAAIAVHRSLGPGLLESAYEACLAFEPVSVGRRVERQQPLPVDYRSVRIDCGFRIDLLVDARVIVEVKAVSRLLPIHDAQLITYLKLSGLRVGLLINFNSVLLRDGVRRLVR